MAWMVTGGAGYIGAHVVRALMAAGRDVVVLDDLSSGDRRRVPEGVPLVQAAVSDMSTVEAALRQHRVSGVVHLAAKKAVEESVMRPLHYYRENVCGMVALLEAMHAAGTRRVVFSSSAAVYGQVEVERVTEKTPAVPISPYGNTKLVGEQLLRDAGPALGLRWVALRYFNVAGAGAPELRDTGTENLVPIVLAAARHQRPARVFGTDYPTPDGSGVRDYVHVLDVADAHVAAVDACEMRELGLTANIGTGVGTSVLEIVDALADALGSEIATEAAPRRAGDAASVVADCSLAVTELGWRSRYTIRDMAASLVD